MTFIIVALLAINLLAVYADPVTIKDCGSKSGKVLEVRVSGCTEADEYCILKRNSNATIDITFEALKNANQLNVIVHGILMDIATPFAMPNPDACTDAGIDCPIQEGNKYEFTTTLPILKSYPRVTVDIKFELKDDDDFVCVRIPAKLH